MQKIVNILYQKKSRGINPLLSQILFRVVRFHGARCNRCSRISALNIRGFSRNGAHERARRQTKQDTQRRCDCANDVHNRFFNVGTHNYNPKSFFVHSHAAWRNE